LLRLFHQMLHIHWLSSPLGGFTCAISPRNVSRNFFTIGSCLAVSTRLSEAGLLVRALELSVFFSISDFGEAGGAGAGFGAGEAFGMEIDGATGREGIDIEGGAV